MAARVRSGQAHTHKKVILTIECVIPAGVRIAELEVKSNWDQPSLRTKKYSLLAPAVSKITARYAGRANVYDKEKV